MKTLLQKSVYILVSIIISISMVVSMLPQVFSAPVWHVLADGISSPAPLISSSDGIVSQVSSQGSIPRKFIDTANSQNNYIETVGALAYIDVSYTIKSWIPNSDPDIKVTEGKTITSKADKYNIFTNTESKNEYNKRVIQDAIIDAGNEIRNSERSIKASFYELSIVIDSGYEYTPEGSNERIKLGAKELYYLTITPRLEIQEIISSNLDIYNYGDFEASFNFTSDISEPDDFHPFDARTSLPEYDSIDVINGNRYRYSCKLLDDYLDLTYSNYLNRGSANSLGEALEQLMYLYSSRGTPIPAETSSSNSTTSSDTSTQVSSSQSSSSHPEEESSSKLNSSSSSLENSGTSNSSKSSSSNSSSSSSSSEESSSSSSSSGVHKPDGLLNSSKSSSEESSSSSSSSNISSALAEQKSALEKLATGGSTGGTSTQKSLGGSLLDDENKEDEKKAAEKANAIEKYIVKDTNNKNILDEFKETDTEIKTSDSTKYIFMVICLILIIASVPLAWKFVFKNKNDDFIV